MNLHKLTAPFRWYGRRVANRPTPKSKAIFIASTLAITVFLFWILIIQSVLIDSLLYFATSRTETVYLNFSQEVDPAHDVHIVKGCQSLPCTSDGSSLYFRIHPTMFNHIWSLFNNGNIFFPDYVAAAIPPGNNRCLITSYGIRMKFFVRNWDIYPELLYISCMQQEPAK